MTWSEVRKTLTTPPAPRPPAPKHPVFTTDPFSTKSFGPGHLVGAAVLGLGLYGAVKFFVARGKAEAERTRMLADQQQPSRSAESYAQADNARGQYGKRP